MQLCIFALSLQSQTKRTFMNVSASGLKVLRGDLGPNLGDRVKT